MKKLGILLVGLGFLLVAFVVALLTMRQPEPKEPANSRTVTSISRKRKASGRVLVVYMSRTGHTKQVAEELHRHVGGDLYQLKTQKTYPQSYQKMLDVAQSEQDADARPRLKGQLPKLARYQTIFLGYPIWWDKNPMAINTFLEHYPDFKGKTIYPFTTSGSSGLGSSIPVIRQNARNAKIGKGLAMTDAEMKRMPRMVATWMEEN